MATHKRINITIHPIELKKLDKIAASNNETRSGMITRLIQEYELISDAEWIHDKTEMAYYAPDKKKTKNKK